jgi:hypothetical protein
MKVVRPKTNEEGRLWTQNTVTPHQFYAVPGNKMRKLIFRLSYVDNSSTLNMKVTRNVGKLVLDYTDLVPEDRAF